jgi:hypothetical protein
MITDIQRFYVTTKGGNTLQFFYNPDNDLVVVDLIAANEQGGNELYRRTLDEKAMLGHTQPKKARKPKTTTVHDAMLPLGSLTNDGAIVTKMQ